MKFRWLPALDQPLLAGQVAKELGLPPLLAQCLLNRGLSDIGLIANFLKPKLAQLSDPFLLPNMAKAVDRLLQARDRREQIVIFGDYDVDGVTSTALLLEVLTTLGWSAAYYLPHRLEEGYGLSREAVETCLGKIPATLVVAVDCGSTNNESIAWLAGRGVDVIVLDHHQVSSPPPLAAALVNPRLVCVSGSKSPSSVSSGREPWLPFADLCSVGLAFKLAHALVKRGRELGLAGAAELDLRLLLDLVALGTIADVVPLTGENRILVSAGLERLNSTRRPGLVALKMVAQSPVSLGVHEVGFQLGPRLNAAGRLETAEEALRLLLARDMPAALALARDLDASNRDRQKLERKMSVEAIDAVRAQFNPETDFVIVEARSSWHIGVVGIVASRVLQEFYRPTIILGGEGDERRGSGRSIEGFDLAAALRGCDDLLIRHGGHAMAAGLTIRSERVDALRERLNELARRALKAEQLQRVLRLDAEVGLEQLSLDSLGQLANLKPVGQGNPPLHFFTRNLVHQRPLQRLGTERQHVKMWVSDGTVFHEAVWWGAGQGALPVGRFDLAFAPQINEFKGRRTVQLKVLDWREAEPKA